MSWRLRLPALLAAVAICSVAAGGSDARAQSDGPPAYVLVELNITDPDGFQAYAEKVPVTIAQHGGTVIVNAVAETIEGAAPEGRVIILRFGSTGDAQSWLNSPDYAAIKGIRHQTADTRQLLVEGPAGRVTLRQPNASFRPRRRTE